jgi:tyrosyl-tRNA synthetase
MTTGMNNAYDVLQERGFIAQVTDEALRDRLGAALSCYAGFDPTADSLHVGHLLPVMALAHMQRCGHRPIVLVGGGTALIGDPSGKNEMRRILSRDEVTRNAECIKQQLSRYVSFEGSDSALCLNNADWLTPLNYIDFLRDIGRHFSVNRMLAAESYRARLETGLNFIEFNYMLLQSYDFLYLYRNYDCALQIGGNDQWGNIVAGIDLIRRVAAGESFGLTFPLITTAAGTKMGKTESGAVWLDPARTSPYQYYQFWINTDDRDVERFLLYFTFLPIDSIRSELVGGIQKAKELLAFEATRLTHDDEAADQARQAARSAFYGDGDNLDSIPATSIEESALRNGVPAFILFADAGLCASRAAARRLLTEGGGYVNGERIASFEDSITLDHVRDGAILLRAGKKRFHRVLVGRSVE